MISLWYKVNEVIRRLLTGNHGQLWKVERALFMFKCKVFIVSNLNEVVHLCIRSNVITPFVHRWALLGVMIK